MSKRRINHQQSHRIHQKQTRFQEQAASNQSEALLEGLVIKRYNRLALIESSDGQQHRCAIRPDVHALVAGDKVVWQPEDHGAGVILSILPRLSVLSRPDFRGVMKPVAANITQVMIVVAPVPEISWALLDSYLVMTEILHLQACIVLNKTDLLERASPSIKNILSNIYEPLGYPILYLSRRDEPLSQNNTTNQDVLMKTLNAETSVFVGQSGVGKSSIISRILPHEPHIETQDISEHTELGRHTTSNSCLYHLSCGGHLIDSPGIREFGLWDMPVKNIAAGFREFNPFIAACQFRNCNHQNAPGCAVMQALDKGVISTERYHSYVKLTQKFTI